MTKWFGDSWGAPVCDPDTHVDTPVDEPCAYCMRLVLPGDQGVIIPHIDPAVRTTYSAWHLNCFLRSIGAKAWRRKGDGTR